MLLKWTNLLVKPHLGPKTGFVLLSDSFMSDYSFSAQNAQKTPFLIVELRWSLRKAVPMCLMAVIWQRPSTELLLSNGLPYSCLVSDRCLAPGVRHNSYTRLGIADHALTHCSSCYNGCLVSWTVLRFSGFKSKPIIFYVGLHLSQCQEHLHCHDFVWPLLVACTISLRYEYSVPEIHVHLAETCLLYEEPCFTCAAVWDGGYLKQIRRRDKRESLLIELLF